MTCVGLDMLGRLVLTIVGGSVDVSEYQYYSFLAVDHPLGREQIAELRALSTRAEITSTSFENHYNYGDFRGDPKALVEQYFDGFLYLANWGSRQLLLRLPCGALDLATARRYCHADAAAVWASEDAVILDLSVEGYEDDDWDVSGSGWLASIIPIRADLLAGDRRSLYLAWLLSVQHDEIVDDSGVVNDSIDDDPGDDLEPPVPPGLGQLTGSLSSLVDFLGIDADLVAAAAERSEPLTFADSPAIADLDRWAAELPQPEKDEVLRRVLRGETVGLRAELLRRYRRATSACELADDTGENRRTVRQLLQAADGIRAKRQQREAEQRAAEQARRERAAEQARQRRLANLRSRGDVVWDEIEAMAVSKKPGEYDRAVALLVDLQTLAAADATAEAFGRLVAELRQRHERKPSLMGRLDAAGLPGTAGGGR